MKNLLSNCEGLVDDGDLEARWCDVDVDADADAESLRPEGGDGNVAHADLELIFSKQMVVI